jgi:hypothetical protein
MLREAFGGWRSLLDRDRRERRAVRLGDQDTAGEALPTFASGQERQHGGVVGPGPSNRQRSDCHRAPLLDRQIADRSP